MPTSRNHSFFSNLSGKSNELSNSNTERDLVIMVSEDLSWEVQIENIEKKANIILGMLWPLVGMVTVLATKPLN